MSLHYFIDGYNLLHSTNRFGSSPIQVLRAKLLQYIEEQHLSGSSKNSVTIVFDGHASDQRFAKGSFINVIFSNDNDADTVIKEKVDGMSNPRNAIVVTNDKSIQKWVRGAGAHVISCEDFLRGSVQKKPSSGAKGKVDLPTENEINTELRKIWKL